MTGLGSVCVTSGSVVQMTTHWPANNVHIFPKIGPGYFTIDKNDSATQEAYRKRLDKFKVCVCCVSHIDHLELLIEASALLLLNEHASKKTMKLAAALCIYMHMMLCLC